MKILYIIPHFYPAVSFGGPVTATFELAKDMVKKGHEVSVYTTDVSGKDHRVPVKRDKIEGVDIHYFPVFSTHLAYQYNLYFAASFYLFLAEKIHTFDVVHIHELYSPENLFAAFLSVRKNIPFCISPHGSLNSAAESSKHLPKKMFMFLARKIYSKADVFFSLTVSERKEWERFGIPSNRIAIIPNGVGRMHSASLSETDNFLAANNIKKNQPIILYLGRLHKIKNLELLIDSFRMTLKVRPSAFLILAGPDAGEAEKLKARCASLLPPGSFLFHGVADEKIRSVLLRISTVFVLTSFSEGLSQSVLEALSEGVPVVATKGCNLEFMQKAEAGYVTSYDPLSLSEKINIIIKNRELRNKLGKNAKKIITDSYLPEFVFSQYEKIYEKAIAHHQ